MKFFIPEQPVIRLISVTATTTEQKRLFISVSFICIASVIGQLDHQPFKNTTLFVLCKRNNVIFGQQFDDVTQHVRSFLDAPLFRIDYDEILKSTSIAA